MQMLRFPLPFSLGSSAVSHAPDFVQHTMVEREGASVFLSGARSRLVLRSARAHVGNHAICYCNRKKLCSLFDWRTATTKHQHPSPREFEPEGAGVDCSCMAALVSTRCC